jgi:hypothetical protein
MYYTVFKDRCLKKWSSSQALKDTKNQPVGKRVFQAEEQNSSHGLSED